ncbi:phosphate ABC transporter ATP-binding protein [Methylophaga lonarensis MPL]|uniref:Phosphate ABC transporter ATP-binding protein n=1 Tax=Methylophaga lonarensis MPL TaxID=1286106 RepID=M7P3D4_9GAMM|nr:phosphate ABC transporter ATP-binding protein [Methylophaga lonarensis]EMR14027.1 phosphate ABC transporter ATP-binding protein [Methylophaga lonarensis MPL]
MLQTAINLNSAAALHPAILTAASAPSAGILQTQQLNIHYGLEQRLFDINISIAERQVTAIMGPSGCGKSTLLKSLNRTLELTPGAEVTSGSVYFGELDIYQSDVDARAVRKVIGIIHQRPQPFPMSIEENVLFGVRFHQRLKRSQRQLLAERYLTMAGLWDEVKDRLHQSAHQLSGGQQQRLCLARTLANQPQIILMDEPCSSLDPASTERIEQLVQQLKNDYTIVIVTHNIAQSRRLADQALLMMEGRVIENAPAAQLFANPTTVAGQDFLQGRIG